MSYKHWLAQAELDQVIIGKGNQVKESDITLLPYLQAIVKELKPMQSSPTILSLWVHKC